jgi:hypothetical protein
MFAVSSLNHALESTVTTRDYEKETPGLVILPHPKKKVLFPNFTTVLYPSCWKYEFSVMN